MAHSVNRTFGERMRQRIEGTNVARKLIEYVEADPKEAPKIMTPHQATVALALLKKVSPDLSNRTLSIKKETLPPRLMRRADIEAELQNIIIPDPKVIEHEPITKTG